MSKSQEPLKFEYRPLARKIYLWTVGVLLLSCLIIVRVRMVEVLEEETLWAVGKLILACSVPLSFLFRLVFFVQPRLFSSYEVTDSDLYRVRGKKRHHFSFDDIQSVKISWFSPRFLGGFSITTNSGQRLIFLSALEDSHKILDRIVHRRPHLLESSRLEKYLEQSRLVNVSWSRLKQKALEWRLILVKFLAVPLVITAVAVASGWSFGTTYTTFDNFIYQLLIFLCLFLALGLFGNAVEEKVVLSRVKANSSDGALARDLTFEKRIARLIDGLFLGLAFGVGILLVALA